jgi:hypothetical protein
MAKSKLFSLDFFRDFHDKENFFEKLTSNENNFSKILNQYMLLNICSFLYGVVMGSYNGFRQAISSGIKVPLLISLALLICFPAFFIIQHVLGSRLGFWQMFKIILSGFVMIALVMVSFAPIVIFFLITGDNYSFLKILHVAIFGLSGVFGMKTIVAALQFSCEKKNVYPKIGVTVFRVWIVILTFVGMQLSWNLRPFIGSRQLQFELFRKREGNFYLTVIRAAGDLITSPEKNKIDKQVNEPVSQDITKQAEKVEISE